MPNHLMNFIDIFISQEIKNGTKDILQRSRISVFMSFGLALGIFIASSIRLVTMGYADFNEILFFLSSITLFINPFLLRMTSRYLLASSIIPILLAILFPFAALNAGGFDAPIMFAFPMIFIISMFLMETKHAFILIAFLFLEIIVLFINTKNIVDP